MTESVLQSTLDFCANIVAPSLMSIDEPVLEPQALATIIGVDEEAKEVMQEINSRKVINKIYNWAEHFGDNVNGFSVVLKRGSLGLQRLD